MDSELLDFDKYGHNSNILQQSEILPGIYESKCSSIVWKNWDSHFRGNLIFWAKPLPIAPLHLGILFQA